jgi:hypothetical protein
VWEWEARFVRKEGAESGFEELDVGKEGEEMVMRGISLSW